MENRRRNEPIIEDYPCDTAYNSMEKKKIGLQENFKLIMVKWS